MGENESRKLIPSEFSKDFLLSAFPHQIVSKPWHYSLHSVFIRRRHHKLLSIDVHRLYMKRERSGYHSSPLCNSWSNVLKTILKKQATISWKIALAFLLSKDSFLGHKSQTFLLHTDNFGGHKTQILFLRVKRLRCWHNVAYKPSQNFRGK